jgi:hypothetical protein
LGWAQWLTPIIPATQDAETRRAGSRPALTNSSRDPILKMPNTKKGWRSGSSGKSALLVKMGFGELLGEIMPVLAGSRFHLGLACLVAVFLFSDGDFFFF